MKRADLITILSVAAVICGFAFIPGAWAWFNTTTANHGLLMSFFKFALLGTFGEMLALRIREGVYMKKGFGLLPKLLIWGILGVVIASAMTIFKTGTVKLLDGGFHLNGKAAEWFAGSLSWGKFFVALCVSVLMNTLFAPVFMTFHKITDIHIAETGGTLRGSSASPWRCARPCLRRSTGTSSTASSSPRPSPCSGIRHTPSPSCCLLPFRCCSPLSLAWFSACC